VQQLHAVERAVAASKKTLVHDHIDHCLAHAIKEERPEPRGTIEEFKEVTKYLCPRDRPPDATLLRQCEKRLDSSRREDHFAAR
jgi:aryl-alcohol dehydrogenase-like predicted oxidoreductase